MTLRTNFVLRKRRPWLLTLVAALLSCLVASCAVPQLRAEERIFLDLSLDFLGEYSLPQLTYEGMPVGGLSGLTYDRQRDRFYAISDDHRPDSPARFYTLRLTLSNDNTIGIKKIDVEDVTLLADPNSTPYPQGSIDAEGIGLSPRQTVFISSEGVPAQGIAPFIQEFDLTTGQQRLNVPLPSAYIPDTAGTKQQRGIVNNSGFEALTLDATSSLPNDPFRLFAAIESALVQDRDPSAPDQGNRCRLLHYVLGDGPPVLISEHLYPLEPTADATLLNGLTELVALDRGGHLLSLERSAGLLGYGAKIYQLATGSATDTTRIKSLTGDLTGKVEPVKKRLLLDLSELDITLDNLEGMALGPRLPDGTQSLLVVSDNNFYENQPSQFLLFRLKGLS